MTRSIKIGCCGFRSARDEYYALQLPAVEVQHTFYQPPQVATLAKWRAEAPPAFEFTIKAWQLITHTARSPTYKRLKRELTEEERDEAGSFRASDIVREAWKVTRACARALDAQTILFQCPASFRPTDGNIANLRRFCTALKPEREGLHLCWEPRGDWPRELIRSLCTELDLWHTVDPFAARTVTPERCYFRLHGRGGWRYQYEDDELAELLALLPPNGQAYVFFNNIKMIEDAVRFQELVARAGVTESD
jgi:uncharacterized protein YecE (DUF72 family)